MQTQFLHIIDVLGVFAFAVSGAFFAMEKKLDPFGVLIVSFVTSIGGGTLRDILIGKLPVTWLSNEWVAIVIISSAFATMIFGKFLKKFNSTFFMFDALGLGLYTIYGIEMGIERGFSTGVCIALGTITASFGGVIRDVLLNHVPLIFRKEIYAMASVTGGLLFFLLHWLKIDNDAGRVICILAIFLIRLTAVRFKLSLPLFYANK